MYVHINVAVDGLVPRSFAWISLQRDGSISIGLKDKTFKAERVNGNLGLWNISNRIRLQYVLRHAPHLEEFARNPHATFHPPHILHIKANNDHEIFSGIARPGLVVPVEGAYPWLYLASKAIIDLETAGAMRNPNEATVETIVAQDPRISIVMGVNFVRRGDPVPTGYAWNRCYDWHDFRIHAFAQFQSRQVTTFAWIHEA